MQKGHESPEKRERHENFRAFRVLPNPGLDVNPVKITLSVELPALDITKNNAFFDKIKKQIEHLLLNTSNFRL
jgi:hypothetical protein